MGADVVVEVTGDPAGLSQALTLVRPRGTVVLKSTCGIPAAGFDQTRAVVQEIRLIGSRCGNYQAALDLLGSGEVAVECLIERRYSLDQIAKAFDDARHCLKVILEIA